MSLLDIPLIGLNELLTEQVVIQRDQATKDSLGGRAGRDFQDLATVPSFHFWGTSAVITRMGSIQQRPESTVDLETGGIILPEGTDVTPRDRISNILDAAGDVIEEGPFEILAVGQFQGMTEISFRRLT